MLENLVPGADPLAVALFCDDLRDLTLNTPHKGVAPLLRTFKRYGFELGVKTEEYRLAGKAVLVLGKSLMKAVCESWECQQSTQRPSSAVPSPLSQWVSKQGKSTGMSIGKWIPQSEHNGKMSYRPRFRISGDYWTLSVQDKLALAICLDLLDFLKSGRWSQLRNCNGHHLYSAKRSDVKSCGRATCVRSSR